MIRMPIIRSIRVMVSSTQLFKSCRYVFCVLLLYNSLRLVVYWCAEDGNSFVGLEVDKAKGHHPKLGPHPLEGGLSPFSTHVENTQLPLVISRRHGRRMQAKKVEATHLSREDRQ